MAGLEERASVRTGAAKRVVVALLFACASLVAAGPVWAQERPADPRLVTLLASAANRRWYVRLTAAGDSVFTGTITSGSSRIARVEGHEIPTDAIRVLERRDVHGSGGRTGAVIGGVGLGVLGFAFGLGICGIDDSAAGCNEAGAAALGTAIGAALGVTLGGLVGGAMHPGEHRWVQVWPAAPPVRRDRRDF